MYGCKPKSKIVGLEREMIRLARPFERMLNQIENAVGITKNGGEAFKKISKEEQRLLSDIARCPLSSVVSRYARLGLNRYQGNKLQQSLLSKGLISWRTLSTRKGRLKILVLTDKGKKEIPDVRIEKFFIKRPTGNMNTGSIRLENIIGKEGIKSLTNTGLTEAALWTSSLKRMASA